MQAVDIEVLEAYGGSRRLVEVLASTGVRDLYPPQAMAVEAGLLSGEAPFVVAAPTASGKTLIAELAMLKVFLEGGGKVIYLVPLRALAREKYDEFTRKYRAAGVRVIQSTGDYDSAEPWLQRADLIISTNEKMDSLVRHRAPWLRDVGLVIADEIHLLGDPHRGPTLEVVLTRLRLMSPEPRLIALSATIPNAVEIAGWLNARLVEADWRPVPLREGVFYNGAEIFNDGTVRWVPRESRWDAVNLALETIRDGGQALVFVNTRKSTETVARNASPYVTGLLSEAERLSLRELSGRVLAVTAEPTRICRRLAECVACGVAFHHAGINHAQRRLIEDAFRAGGIKLIAATTTLAMGLNLPSRRVVIRDWWRYETGLGIHPLAAIEIKQMSGRAGRPGLDEYGEAVIVARSKRDEEFLFRKYITGELERIESRLGSEPALRTHVLASVAGLFTTTHAELAGFLEKTFFAFQSGAGRLASIAEEITGFLEAEGMMVREGAALAATRFGRRVSELYIDPLTAVVLRDALHRFDGSGPLPIFQMIAHTPDMMVLSLRKGDYDEMIELFYAHAGELLLPEEERYPSEELLAEMKTASLLLQWIEETPEERMVSRFGIGPGDLRTLVELSDWLLYSAAEIGRVFRLREAVRAVSLLRTRVVYGVREELLQLVTLRGIGRVRARRLFDAGFRGLKEIREATAGELAAVPTIGKALAEDLKRQVEGKKPR